MIQANELRIGNWVFSPLAGMLNVIELRRETMVYGTVMRTKQSRPPYSDCEAEEVVLECQYNEIAPIPLTPELLEQCGFRKPNEHEIDVRDGCSGYIKEVGAEYIYLIQEGDHFMLGENYDTFLTASYKHKFHYLHQLQNLVFALTGEELEVKSLHAAL